MKNTNQKRAEKVLSYQWRSVLIGEYTAPDWQCIQEVVKGEGDNEEVSPGAGRVREAPGGCSISGNFLSSCCDFQAPKYMSEIGLELFL